MSRPPTFFLVATFGVACTFAGWSAAQAGDAAAAILRPKSNEAIALPARGDPPANCDAQHAGWIYLDTEVGEAAFPCACVRNSSKVWDWVVLGAALPGKLCE